MAFVVLRGGATVTEAQLKRHTLDNAPAFQHPRRIWLVDAMPLASTSKVDRTALRRQAEAAAEADRLRASAAFKLCPARGGRSIVLQRRAVRIVVTARLAIATKITHQNGLYVCTQARLQLDCSLFLIP